MSALQDTLNDLNALSRRIDEGMRTDTVGWSFADFLVARDLVDRARYQLGGMVSPEGRTQLYQVVGEFDDDEEHEYPVIGVCETQQEAMEMANRADNLLDKLRVFDKLSDINDKEFQEQHPRPQMFPRKGKLTQKDFEEIAQERVVYGEWAKLKTQNEQDFRKKSYPELDALERQILPLVEKYASGIWEGGFSAEPVPLLA